MGQFRFQLTIMKWLVLISLVSLVKSEDYSCPSGKSTKTITVKDGDSFSFNSNPDDADNYENKEKCTVKYKRGGSCKELKFECQSFDLQKGDKLIIGKNKYFLDEDVSETTTKKVMKVRFISNKKKTGSGAQCTIECSDPEAPGVTETPSTTEGPGVSRTTEGSTTTAATEEPTTTGTTTVVPCVNCTTETGGICQFPFIFQGQTFTSCTSYLDDKPWCSTKVDQFNNFIAGAQEWGYCNSDCPDDQGYPATGAGPACEVRTTGYGYPDQCAERLARSNKNILFLGNSYTYGNDLPGMVRNLASAAGKSATTTMKAPGGQTLSGHVSGGTLNTIRGGDWDAVVIQDQSQRPSFGAGYVFYNILPDADMIVDAIRETNPCTQPIYYLTWGKRDGDSNYCSNGNYMCTFEGIQDQLTAAYTTMAYVTQPASVAPAGEAWRTYSNRNGLFAGDGSHASSSGTYLTACTMLETLWPDVSSVGNSYRPVGDASALQDLARQTVTSRVWSWPEAGPRPCEGCLP